jgi:type III secretion protein T
VNPLDEWLVATMRQIIGAHHLVMPFKEVLMVVALVSLRYAIVVMIVPVFMAQIMTGVVRASFVLSMSFFTAIGTPLEMVAQINGIEWAVFALREVLLGAALGFALSIPFWAAEGVGATIDMQVGYNNVQHTDPLSGQESTPVSQMLLQVLVGVFVAAGGLMLVVGTVMASFQVWPVTAALPSLQGLAEQFLPQEMDSLASSVVKFASAVLLVLVLIDLGVGFVSRSADKLQVNEMSRPLKAAAALLIIALLMGTFMTQLRAYIVPDRIVEKLRAVL